MKKYGLLAALWLAWDLSMVVAEEPAPEVVVGSKSFTEGVILGELATQQARHAGARVTHKQELGGTRVLWNALLRGEIDVYAEYTGTISQEIFAGQGMRDLEAIRQAMAELGIRMSKPLGFNNPYAIGMKEAVAAQKGIRTISDLQGHSDLKFGFSNEFMDRGDGWPGLRQRYGLPQKNVSGLEHALAYRALDSGGIDATDLYSTDAEIKYYDLRILQDDRNHFPLYYAVLLYRSDLGDRALDVEKALLELEGRIPRLDMVEMNARARPKTQARVPESQVAAEYLNESPYFRPRAADEDGGPLVLPAQESMAERLLWLTLEHLFLVAVSLTASILIALPLGIVATKWSTLGQVILAVTGIIQTIPALALLVFIMALLYLIRGLPLFHNLATIGTLPAIIALFLYGLLPIVRNTFAGLHDIPVAMRESAQALGLSAVARLRLVELPMAARSILAGIKTSAVINVGTATLGALIGAGGYGQPILTGLRLDNMGLILQGAVPAAALALLMQGLFELAERKLVSRGLRLQPAS